MHRLTLLSVIPAFVWPFGLMYGCATPSAPASTGTPDAVAVSAIQAAPGNDSSSGTPDRGGSVINTQMDSIDGLVARLAASPLWNNGVSPKIDLPPTASAQQLVANVLDRISFARGKAESRSILRTRQIQIGDDKQEYEAVVVDTSLGRKIVLLRYEGKAVGWWSRVYDEDDD